MQECVICIDDCADFYASHRLHRPTSAHILEPSWKNLYVCPDSGSFENNLYTCFAALLPVLNLKGIVSYA